MGFKDFLKTSLEAACEKYSEAENKCYEDYDKYSRIYSNMNLEELKKEKMHSSSFAISSPGRYRALVEAIEEKESSM